MRWAAAALLPVLATAHPSNLQCDDPRFREGGIMMHNWVTDNQFTDGMVLATSKKTYKPGDTIGLTVATNGTKFAGAFFAIQSLAWCTLTGDHGTFGSLAGPLQQGCLSSFFTNASFSGTASATWTAGPDTAGPVTIRIIWGNGPSASDPLSKQGVVVVPDSYLYTKTVTLTNEVAPVRCPAITPGVDPQPPPPKKGSKGSCVHNGVCPGEGVNSPVFIQSLRNDEGEQTFPSAKCIPCRIDHRHRCKSAMVTCPTSWTSPAPVEKIWLKSKSCSGEPDRVVELPRAFAHCPAPSHYSAEEKHLDLERFVPKLQRDHKSYFPDEATARAAIREYRRMLTLIQKFPELPVVPSKLVDLVWHEHILDTQQYRRDCLRMFGHYIHHNPSFGGAEEKAELVAQQQAMLANYAAVFGDAAPAAVWPGAPKKKVNGFNEGTPDCCSAKCAKPDCHSCVGCNALDCAYLAQTENAKVSIGGVARQLSPEVAAGYVPISEEMSAMKDAPAAVCSVNPQPDTVLQWHICNNEAYFQHTLAGPNGGWYAVGISGKEPFVDMSGGDYVLSLPTGNYTGIKDAYRWQPGNGYPCFDVEFECSEGNKTKGSMDLKNGQIVRTQQGTSSTWSRALHTGDSKDRDIPNGNVTVLFARGHSDYLFYHQGDRNTCVINFFDGTTQCQPVKGVPGRPENPALRGSEDLVRRS
eukprot:TRINITY_DN244_c0_g1_i6.p2 TRINITY_DN244_c0_g1~~TRINITY_DN244_c0_g1_i6.p2  ORF type:complete len:720 (+),score=262.12 TRINITY_DN244_c0_g1_i6:81-2162(+)